MVTSSGSEALEVGEEGGEDEEGEEAHAAAVGPGLPAVAIETITIKLASSGWCSIKIHDVK
jgi:hypothetical protein